MTISKYTEEVAPLKIEVTNHSGHGLIINHISLKQRVLYKTFQETRGPRTELIHRLNFSEKIDCTPRKITRFIQYPIPSVHEMPPTLFTPILQVSHVMSFTLKSLAYWSKPVKVEVPIVIGGFPFTLFDESSRRSVDTLPVYVAQDDDDVEDDSSFLNGHETSAGSSLYSPSALSIRPVIVPPISSNDTVSEEP